MIPQTAVDEPASQNGNESLSFPISRDEGLVSIERVIPKENFQTVMSTNQHGRLIRAARRFCEPKRK
jgi:hypothetical protein